MEFRTQSAQRQTELTELLEAVIEHAPDGGPFTYLSLCLKLSEDERQLKQKLRQLAQYGMLELHGRTDAAGELHIRKVQLSEVGRQFWLGLQGEDWRAESWERERQRQGDREAYQNGERLLA